MRYFAQTNPLNRTHIHTPPISSTASLPSTSAVAGRVSADPFLQHPPIPFLHRTPTAPLAPTGSDRAPLPTRIPTLPPRPPAKLFPLRTWQSTPPAHRLSRRSSTAPAPLRLTIIQTSDEAHHQGPSLEHGSWLPYGIAMATPIPRTPRWWVHQFTTRTCNLQVSSSLYPSLLPPIIAWSCSPLLTGYSGRLQGHSSM